MCNMRIVITQWLLLTTLTRAQTQSNSNSNLRHSITVLETHPTTKPIFLLQDNASPSGDVDFKFLSTSPNQDKFRLMRVNASSTFLSLVYSLRSGAQTHFELDIIAVDSQTGTIRSSHPLLIVVIRNTPPYFSTSNYVVTISAYTPARSTVYHVTATDNDTYAPFNELEYAMLPDASGNNGVSEIFMLTKDGHIRLISALPRRNSVYTINVKVRDGGNPRLDARTRVQITASIDVAAADAPVFNQSVYRVGILETQRPTDAFLTVHAVDPNKNQGLRGVVYYEMIAAVPASISAYFGVEPHSGHIHVRDYLGHDPTLKKQYQFRVIAYDLGKPRYYSLPVRVIVDVVRNEHAPIFTDPPYKRYINSTVSPGGFIFRVSATDADTRKPLGNVYYRLFAFGPINSSLTIDNHTGEIHTTQKLDPNDNDYSSLMIGVIAYDGGIPAKSSDTTVELIFPRNLHAPVITNGDQILRMSEDQRTGIVLYTVKATDADLMEPFNVLRYTIEGEGSEPDFFRIDAQTGDLYLEKSIKTTINSHFRLRIVVRDGGPSPKSAIAYIELHIIRKSKARFGFLSPSEFKISFEHNKRYYVGFVTAGPGANVRYQVISRRTPGSYFFKVDPVTGVIWLRKSLQTDPDRRVMYNLQISANRTDPQDKRSLIITQWVTIRVKRNEHDPKFTRPVYTVTIPDSSPPGVNIITVRAFDADGDLVQYRIKPDPNGHWEYFYISPRSGIVYVKKPFVDTKINVFNVTVVGRDDWTKPRWGEAILSVTVTGDMSPPVFTNLPATIVINTTYPDNYVIYRIRAVDSDMKGTMKYQFHGHDLSAAFFSMTDRGVVSVRNISDIKRDYHTQYSVRVSAYDSAYPGIKTNGALRITVIRNLYHPEIAGSYSIRLATDTPQGTALAVVNATDQDGDDITFSITKQHPAVFYINPVDGQISIKVPIPSLYINTNTTITVRATDNGIQPKHAETKIPVSFLGNSPPKFTALTYYGTAWRNDPLGTPVAQFDLTTTVVIGEVKVEIIGEYPGQVLFAIGPKRQIIVNIPLGNDPTPTTRFHNYTLVLAAYDSQFPSHRVYTSVIVRVDRNKFRPQFTLRAFHRVLTSPIRLGEEVLQLNATDGDRDSVTYTLHSQAQGDFDKYFYLIQSTGAIYLRNKLDVNTPYIFNTSAVCSDVYIPSRMSDPVPVSIEITDRAIATTTTRHPPTQHPGTTAAPKVYNVSVYDTLPVDSVAFVVEAEFKPPAQGAIVYQVTGEGLAPQIFHIDSESGNVTLQKSLRYHSAISYHLMVKVYDSLKPASSMSILVNISVIRNPHYPSFHRPLTVNISELFPVSEPFYRIKAYDADNDTLIYELHQNPNTTYDPLKWFMVAGRTGDLYVRKSLKLDSSNRLYYTMLITARDQHFPEKTGTSEININVKRNHYTPRFPPSYMVNISDQHPVNEREVVTVKAVDIDSENTLRYKMMGSFMARHFFYINEKTGQVFVRKLLTEGREKMFNITIGAYDPSYPEDIGLTHILIYVIRNPSTPRFINTPYTKTISNNTPITTVVFNVTAIDDDGDSITYGWGDNFSQQTPFLINRHNGQISIISMLPQNPTTYRLNVTATDDHYSYKTSWTLVTLIIQVDIVTIEWVNLPTTIRIPANTSQSEPVFRAQARSLHKDVDLKFAIVGKYPARTFFEMFGNDVIIKRSLKNDSLKLETYVLLIDVYDPKFVDRPVQGELTVHVVRNANSPKFKKRLYTKTIHTSHDIKDEVLQVSATDADQDVLSYRLVGNNTVLRQFHVTPQTGGIVLTRPLTHNTSVVYSFIIEATDQQTKPRVAQARVEVTVRPRAILVFKPPFSVSVKVSQPVDVPFHSVVAMDNSGRLASSNIRYHLEKTPPDSDFFNITTNGNLSVSRLLHTDPTWRTSYMLRIEAYDVDDSRRSSRASFHVRVIRNENSPQFVDETYSAVAYDYDPVGHVVVTVSATDDDLTFPENEVVYSLVLPSDASPYFSIHPLTGAISINRQLYKDPQKRSKFQFKVHAKDHGLQEKVGEAEVRVDVRHNSHTPVFNPSSYTVNITEMHDVMMPIVTVTATDKDEKRTRNSDIRYSIKSPSSGFSYFYIDSQTGAIYPRTSIAVVPNRLREINLIVQAQDDGIIPLSSTANVTIYIDRMYVDNPYPEVPVYYVNVPYDVDVPHLLNVAVKFIDKQPKGPLIYLITRVTPPVEIFSIDNLTALITLTDHLTNYPNHEVYQVVLQAHRRDAPGEKGSVTVHVNVDRNTNPPVFNHSSLLNVSIPENQPLADPFISINATDPDMDVVTYSLQSHLKRSVLSSSYFAVHPTTGDVYVTRPLSETSDTLFSLHIIAKDNGQPLKQAVCTVTVTVIRNEHAPVFTNLPAQIRISSTTRRGTPIFQLSATDDDGDRMTFSLEVVAPTSNIFAIEPISGNVTITARLPQRARQIYLLSTRVDDSGSPSRGASSYLSIIVADNPSPPQFVRSSYNETIGEYHSVFIDPVVSVKAYDPDVPVTDGNTQFTEITYSLSPSSSPFIVSPVGTIYLNYSLANKYSRDLYELEVTATDHGYPPKNATVPVYISVHRNQFAPVARPKSYKRMIMDTHSNVATILRISATDNDQGNVYNYNTPNAKLSYTVEGTNAFTVDPEGNLRTKNLARVTNAQTYSFRVKISDQSWRPKSTKVSVSVTVVPTKLEFLSQQHYVELVENENYDPRITRLYVEHQIIDRAVTCEIESGDEMRMFDVFADPAANKHCDLVLSKNHELDREILAEYSLNISVNYKNSSNVPNIDYYKAYTQVIVHVLDVNDNVPNIHYPVYPFNTLHHGTLGKVYGYIDIQATIGSQILVINATDPDLNYNGTLGIYYRIINPGVIYELGVRNGALRLKQRLPENHITTHFRAEACDTYGLDLKHQCSQPATIIMNVADERHFFGLRFTLEVPMPYLVLHQERMRRIMQEETKYVVLFEGFIQNATQMENNRSELIFVLIDPFTDTILEHNSSIFQEIENKVPQIEEALIGMATELVLFRVMRDTNNTIRYQPVLVPTGFGKSYVWILEDPAAALIALAAIIILLAVVGIIVLYFVWERYMEFENAYYNRRQSLGSNGLSWPNMLDQPSVIREYETQSLQMNVPPDEDVDSDTASRGHRMPGGIPAAVNPLFNTDDPPKSGNVARKPKNNDEVERDIGVMTMGDSGIYLAENGTSRRPSDARTGDGDYDTLANDYTSTFRKNELGDYSSGEITYSIGYKTVPTFTGREDGIPEQAEISVVENAVIDDVNDDDVAVASPTSTTSRTRVSFDESNGPYVRRYSSKTRQVPKEGTTVL